MSFPFFIQPRSLLLLVAWAIASSGRVVAAGPSPDRVVTVAPDGTGDFPTVQAAIDAAPEGGRQGFEIRLKPGRYHEKLLVPKTKGPLRLRGDAAATTVLTFDDQAETPGADGQKVGTTRSASTTVFADRFSAEDVTFENAFGPGGQAVALNVSCEGATFRRCQFLGWQDTLYLRSGTQYFEDCRIEGSVDFIFGAGTAFFERCELHCRARGAITAASTPEDHAHGFVFARGKITAAPGPWQVYLGRPWRAFASVVFLATELPENVAPAGWLEWMGAPERDKTARYAEYANTGPGSEVSARVAWSRQLGEAEARDLTANRVLGWTPKFDEEAADRRAARVTLYWAMNGNSPLEGRFIHGLGLFPDVANP